MEKFESGSWRQVVIPTLENEYEGLRRRLESMVASAGSMTTDAVLDTLRNEPQWHLITVTDILNACLKDRGLLNFRVCNGKIELFRGELPSLLLQYGSRPVHQTSPLVGLSSVQPLPTVADGEFFPVIVTGVLSPDAIVVNLIGECSERLATLHQAMTAFYASAAVQRAGGLRMPPAECLAADWPCAYPSIVCKLPHPEPQWRRGLISDVRPDGTVIVADVDSGLRTRVLGTELRQLDSQFFRLPRQAIYVRLAYIRPSSGQAWSFEATNRVAQLVRDELGQPQVVMCMVVDQTSSVPSVLLCNTCSSDDVYVNLVLAIEGFALSCETSEKVVQ
ncbi:uncharacterized protein LOC144093546 [Amblyomma americanum]